MGDQFHWEAEDEQSMPPPVGEPPLRHRPVRRRLRLALVFTLAVIAAVAVSARSRFVQTETRLESEIQTILDLERAAFLQGDGDLFFATFSTDPAWRAAQLLPLNQRLQRAGLTVSDVRAMEDEVWVTVAWNEGNSRWQRHAFFRWHNGQLQHVPGSIAFWGERRERTTSWGTLKYREADEPYATAVAVFVADELRSACSPGCAGSPPLTLSLRPDYDETAVADTVYAPSPRLVALTEAGEPASFYWDLLRQKVAAHVQPPHIRFALPPKLPVGIHLVDYEDVAAAFMAAHPGVTIELVTLDEIPTDPAALSAFDGAAFPPTPAMVAAGAVRDLTSFVYSDPEFDRGDFYDQIWRGSWWRERMWFMPQAAEMQVIYYDKNAYEEAGLAEPSLRWTWTEMNRDLAALDEAVDFRPDFFPNYRFYDVTTDVLYAYAAHHDRTAALEWYRQLVAHPRLMPDVSAMTDEERELSRVRWRAAVWVDQLVFYEHRLQIYGSLGVVPFPGSEQFDGRTPLHMTGPFMTQNARFPQATWAWLNFLSYQQTAPRYRLIPARPSLATETGYWGQLPRPLNEAMRVAFPLAQPVTLGMAQDFSWEQVTAVVSGQLTPQQATQQPFPLRWFDAE